MEDLNVYKDVQSGDGVVKYIWKSNDYNERRVKDYFEYVTKQAKKDGNLMKNTTTNYFIQGERGRGYRLSLSFLRVSPRNNENQYRIVFTGGPVDNIIDRKRLSSAIREGILANLPNSIGKVDVLFQGNANRKDYEDLDVDEYDPSSNRGIYSVF